MPATYAHASTLGGARHAPFTDDRRVNRPGFCDQRGHQTCRSYLVETEFPFVHPYAPDCAQNRRGSKPYNEDRYEGRLASFD